MSLSMPVVDALPVGAAPLVGALCDEIHLVEHINERVTWDPGQCLLSPGLRIKALVINTLCGRQPLYRVHEFFEEQDLACTGSQRHSGFQFLLKWQMETAVTWRGIRMCYNPFALK